MKSSITARLLNKSPAAASAARAKIKSRQINQAGS